MHFQLEGVQDVVGDECQREAIVFIPIPVETLGGLHDLADQETGGCPLQAIPTSIPVISGPGYEADKEFC